MQHLPDTVPALLTEIWVLAPTLITAAVVGRAYFGSVIFHPRWTPLWATARKILVPLLDTLLRRRLGSAAPSVTNRALESEVVGLVDHSPKQLATALDTCRDVEVPLLAGYKTDWEGRSESGTLVWYYGPEPFPSAPNWLRPFQVHLTTFTVHTESGVRQLVTAHREANPYRPDLWADHLRKGSHHSVEDGVRRVERALQDADITFDTDHPAIMASGDA